MFLYSTLNLNSTLLFIFWIACIYTLYLIYFAQTNTKVRGEDLRAQRTLQCGTQKHQIGLIDPALYLGCEVDSHRPDCFRCVPLEISVMFTK